jgi:hypothetical protein
MHAPTLWAHLPPLVRREASAYTRLSERFLAPNFSRLATMNGQRHEGWCEGRPDLRWRTIGKRANQHSVRM